MSKYGYLEVFQRVPSTSRLRELTVVVNKSFKIKFYINELDFRVTQWGWESIFRKASI